MSNTQLITDLARQISRSDSALKAEVLETLHNKVNTIIDYVQTLKVDPDHPNPIELKIADLTSEIRTLVLNVNDSISKQTLILEKQSYILGKI